MLEARGLLSQWSVVHADGAGQRTVPATSRQQRKQIKIAHRSTSPDEIDAAVNTVPHASIMLTRGPVVEGIGMIFLLEELLVNADALRTRSS